MKRWGILKDMVVPRWLDVVWVAYIVAVFISLPFLFELSDHYLYNHAGVIPEDDRVFYVDK